jgi:hypothetical protein
MGTLVQGFGGTPQGAANDSFAFSRASTNLEAGSAALGGVGGYQLANYQAAVAANNAKIAQANAQASLQAGDYETEVSGLKTSQVVGAARAAQGANNIDVNAGSAAAVQESTQKVGAMDAAMIHYNALRQAYGQEVEARSLKAQSQLDQAAGLGALSGGFTKAASTILGGAYSVAGRYANWQLQAAPGAT